MNKIVYIGPTSFLGQLHFTYGKIYDVHTYKTIVYYVISDYDGKKYYINIGNSHSPDSSLELVDSLGSIFISLEQWRDNQLNQIGIY